MVLPSSCFIIVLILVLVSHQSLARLSRNYWQDLISVNESCPKFIVVNVRDEGLGDMLERILSGISIAYEAGITLVFYHEFWKYSNHMESGYNDLFSKELGIPIRNVALMDQVKAKYQPLILRSKIPPDVAIFRPDFSDSWKCNTMQIIDDFTQCTAGGTKVWCNSYIATAIQTIVRPVLDESISTISKEPYLSPPLDSSVVNVVWHIRTGDICLHCDNSTKYVHLSNFIAKALQEEPKWNNIVVCQFPDRVHRLFEKVPNVRYYSHQDVNSVVRLFRQTDILISTGSSFPNTVALFTPLHRPILFQALDKDAEMEYHIMFKHRDPHPELVRDKHLVIEGRSVKLDKDWNPEGFQPVDIQFILQSTGVFDRIKNSRSS